MTLEKSHLFGKTRPLKDGHSAGVSCKGLFTAKGREGRKGKTGKAFAADLRRSARIKTRQGTSYSAGEISRQFSFALSAKISGKSSFTAERETLPTRTQDLRKHCPRFLDMMPQRNWQRYLSPVF